MIGHINKGESFLVVAGRKNSDGDLTTTDVPQLYLSSDITQAALLIDNQTMTLSPGVPYFYYSITGDGEDYPPAGEYIGYAKFSDGDAPVDFIVGTFADDFHAAMSSYPESIPAGTPTPVVIMPETMEEVKVYFHCWAPDNQTPLASINSDAHIVDKPHVYEAKGADVRRYAGEYDTLTGIWYHNVSPYSRVHVKIREMGLDVNGYVGAGGTIIRADQLYDEDQTP